MSQVKNELLDNYMKKLELDERCINTQKQYRRDIMQFFKWLDVRELEKRSVIEYKEYLEMENSPVTVNVKLTAINGFFSFLGREDLRVKQLKIQRKVYCNEDRELSKAEYMKLIKTAKGMGNVKLALIIQTIGSIGIRVSELEYITVEALMRGKAHISLRGKNRIVLIPNKLKKALLPYIRQNKLQSGSIFTTRSGKPLDRSNIWRMMKNLCEVAGVESGKVFPHNLRHLFARVFYAIDKDIAKLADVLGHSNINTTRIYIMSNGYEHRYLIESLNLIL